MKIPAITIGLALSGCSQASAPAPVTKEPWPNTAEVLRFTLQQQARELQWQQETYPTPLERQIPQASNNSDNSNAPALPQTTKGVEP